MRLAVSATRFGLVGAGVTLIHILVATSLIEGLHSSPEVANGVAFVLANLLSYVANTRWSFQSRLGLGTWRRFVIVSFAASVLTVAIAWGVHRAGGHYMWGIALVVTVVPILNFVAHRLFTYR